MLIREKYLNQLIAGKDLNLIKVITGVRRCGKSILLLQYKDYLMSQKILEEDIIYMNFESAKWYDIKNYQDLYNYIKGKINNKNKKYILLDEVQNVEKWEKAVNAMLVDFNSDIYITGSNAYLLSSELTTLLAGRVLTIKMYPFSFKEFINSYPFKNNEDRYEKFDKYLKYGGMPTLINMNDNEELIINYLTDANYDLKNRYTHLDYNQSANQDDSKCNNCTLEEQAIIKIIRSKPMIKQEEIANMINKSLRTVKTRMNEMQEKGLIARKNGKRNGEWIIL